MLKTLQVVCEVHVSALLFAHLGLPNIIGAVDGTLITIQKPWVNANEYIWRHKKPQLNVMVSIFVLGF